MAQSSQGEAKEKDIIDVTDDIVTLSCGEELSKALAWKVSRTPKKSIIIKKGLKKKVGIFPKGGGGPSNYGSVSHFFLFIFKHGLNHPEMQRNFHFTLKQAPLVLWLLNFQIRDAP